MRGTPPVWDDGTWAGLPPLEGDTTADVCVVGLGGSGLSAVEELQRLGASVVGVDAGQVAGGAAGRNGGFLLAGLSAFHHEVVEAAGRERAARLYRLTLAELDRIERATPDAVRRTGSLRIAVSDEELEDCHAQLDAMRADDLPVEPYEGPEGRGLLFPADGTVQPLRRCRRLAATALAAGARLHERSPAVEVAGGMVRTPAGVVRCGAVVLAVDGGLELVAPELAGRVRSARAQMLATAPTAEVALERPVYARWGYDYWQQLPDGRVAVGGCRDRFAEDEWLTGAPSGEPTRPVQEALEHLLRDAIGVHAAVTHRWAGVIAFTVDRVPVLEEVRPCVWAVGAYSGTGNVVGAIWGRAAAELASGVPGETVRAIG